MGDVVKTDATHRITISNTDYNTALQSIDDNNSKKTNLITCFFMRVKVLLLSRCVCTALLFAIFNVWGMCGNYQSCCVMVFVRRPFGHTHRWTAFISLLRSNSTQWTALNDSALATWFYDIDLGCIFAHRPCNVCFYANKKKVCQMEWKSSRTSRG